LVGLKVWRGFCNITESMKKEFNAVVVKHGINVSETYAQSLEFWMELKVQGGGGVVFCVSGPWSTNYRNKFAYSLKKVMNVLGTDDLSKVDGKPLRAIFETKDGMFLGAPIVGIKHFLDDDEVFIPREDDFYAND